MIVRPAVGSQEKRQSTRPPVSPLLSDDFHQDAFAPAPVEFSVEDLLPGAEVQLAVGDGNDDFTPHDLTLQMGVGIVLSGIIVAILANRFMGCELFQPQGVVVMQTGLVIVDKDRRGDMHGIDEHHPLAYCALPKAFLDLGRDIDKGNPSGRLEPKLLPVALHAPIFLSLTLPQNTENKQTTNEKRAKEGLRLHSPP